MTPGDRTGPMDFSQALLAILEALQQPPGGDLAYDVQAVLAAIARLQQEVEELEEWLARTQDGYAARLAQARRDAARARREAADERRQRLPVGPAAEASQEDQARR